MATPKAAEDEVMIEEESTDAVDVELDPDESPEGEGAEAGKVVEKTDAAPKQEAAAKTTGEESPEERNARNRQERKDRKERQNRARAERDAELAILREESATLKKQVAELSQKTQTSETNAGMQKAQQDLQLVESVIAKATEDGDGKKLVEAMRVRDQINNHIHTLRAGSTAAQQTKPTQQQQSRPQLDPAIQTHFEQFTKDHPWYQVGANTPDVDSQIVKTIDKAIMAEGFDPKTQDYWDELRDRVAEKLGNKGVAAVTTTAKPAASKGGPQVGSGRSQVMPGRQTYTLSAERLNAMRDAGMDVTDPATLKKYAGIYQKFDRENPQA